jgi:hypothetical protein
MKIKESAFLYILKALSFYDLATLVAETPDSRVFAHNDMVQGTVEGLG